MEGCREEKKIYAFEQGLAWNKKIYYDFRGVKIVGQSKIFPVKRLSIFLTRNQTPFESADFFFLAKFSRQKFLFVGNFFKPKKNFPPKDLKNFSTLYLALLKAQNSIFGQLTHLSGKSLHLAGLIIIFAYTFFSFY